VDGATRDAVRPDVVQVPERLGGRYCFDAVAHARVLGTVGLAERLRGTAPQLNRSGLCHCRQWVHGSLAIGR